MKKKKAIIFFTFVVVSIFVILGMFLDRLVAPIDQQAAVVTGQELRQAGLYDVTSTEFGTDNQGADPTGVRDSTSAIQEAMDTAYRSGGTTFFPPGTYKITKTLTALSERKVKLNYQLVGSTEGSSLPIIKLAPGSFNDNKASNDSKMTYDGKKQAMIHMWGCMGDGEAVEGGVKGCKPPYESQLKRVNKKDQGEGTMYQAVLRNLRFEIGPNNPDAIGVRITGNQSNNVSNIEIIASGAFAGYYGTIGTNSFVQDLTVIGGKYGIYNGYGAWGVYTNVKLEGQELLAFTSPQGPPVSLNGFHIIKQTAPAIGEIPGIGYNSPDSDQGGAFSLNDGRIEFATNSSNEAAIKTLLDKQVSVVNVYIRNSEKLIRAGSTNYLGNANGWSKINIFSNTIPENGYKLIEGIETKEADYVDPNTFVTSNVVPPSADALRMNHGIADSLIESPDKLMRLAKEPGSGVINVANEGIIPVTTVTNTSPDYASQINNLINRTGVHTLFFPKGIYPIKNTITLKANTKIIGIHPGISSIETHPAWTPGQITDMVNTVNDPNGNTVIAFIALTADRGRNNNKFNNLHWMVGKNSVIYNTSRAGKNDSELGLNGCKGLPDIGWGTGNYWLWYTNNGGGRLWGAGASASNCARWSAQNRGIYVNGTTQPLIMYGLNPEDGHGEVENDSLGYMVEINGASNVSIRSDKSENDNALLIRNSSNVFILNLGGSVETSLRDNNNVLIMNTVAKFHTFGKDDPDTPENERRPLDLLEEIVNGNVVKSYDTTKVLSVVKRGNVNFGIWNYSTL